MFFVIILLQSAIPEARNSTAREIGREPSREITGDAGRGMSREAAKSLREQNTAAMPPKREMRSAGMDMQEDLLKKTSMLSEEDMKIFGLLPQERRRKLLQMNREKIAEELSGMRLQKVSKENMFRERALGTSRKTMLRESIAKKISGRLELRARTEKTRIDFNDAHKKAQACDDFRNESCQQLSSDELERAAALAEKVNEEGIAFLERIKAHIELSEQIDDEAASAAIRQIGAVIASLEEKKAEIALAKTKAELKRIIRGLKEDINEARHIAIRLRAQLMHAEAGEIIARGAHYESKIEAILAKAGEDGRLTGDIEEMVAAYSGKVESAREYSQKAKDSYRKAAGLKEDAETLTDDQEDEIKSLFEKSREQTKKAGTLLQESNVMLRAIIESLKDIEPQAEKKLREEPREIEVIVESRISGEEMESQQESGAGIEAEETEEGDTDDKNGEEE